MSPATLAGAVSTVLFTLSIAPMVWRAARTQDLASYSREHLLVTNLGNLVHTVYVVSLPPGPVWLLHSVHVTSTALMLIWKVQHDRRTGTTTRRHAADVSCVPT
jgi:hypothetical protein